MTLEVRDLRFTYEGWPPTLKGVDIVVAPGECAFLLGPSGGGKTTVLRCIAGLEQAYSGAVVLDGRPLEGLPPHRRKIGMIFQEPALFPHLNVWKNVAFGMRYVAKRSRDVPRASEEAQAREWLRLVGLEEKADAPVDELSGGQRQRVALARTLAARPRAVLLDEPLSALDQTLREELGARIREALRRADVPSLWVTHDESEARRLGDRVWRLSGGKAVEASRSL
jgi:putative spermidine/putrescine transport system ATP-binding protein